MYDAKYRRWPYVLSVIHDLSPSAFLTFHGFVAPVSRISNLYCSPSLSPPFRWCLLGFLRGQDFAELLHRGRFERGATPCNASRCQGHRTIGSRYISSLGSLGINAPASLRLRSLPIAFTGFTSTLESPFRRRTSLPTKEQAGTSTSKNGLQWLAASRARDPNTAGAKATDASSDEGKEDLSQ